MLGTIAAFSTGRGLIGIIVLIVGVVLPVMKRKQPPKGAEDLPDAKFAAVGQTGANDSG